MAVLEKVLFSTQSVYQEKADDQTNENILPQKTIDYNSIAEEFTDENDTVIDLIMQTQLKTEPITTPEPSINHISIYLCSPTQKIELLFHYFCKYLI